MLIVALVLAVIGLAALVTAVVTSNELVAWVCIAASVLGVILLIVDAIRERQHRDDEESEAAGVAAVEPDSIAYSADETPDSAYSNFDAEYPENAADEQYPDEVVSDDPESDTISDDEPEYPESSEEDAVHPVDEETTADEAEAAEEEAADEEAAEEETADEESADEADSADERGTR